MTHKFDIFISYARKDFDEVNRFVGMLKERIPSLTCWFDITGIESGDEFEDKIITAINNSAYVLFALSDHSIQSQWTKDEVMYAKNTEKRIIPLLLKGAQLKGWFLFKFGRIDCIDTTNSLQIDKLVKNLSDWTGKRVVSASASEAKPNPSEVSGTKMQSMKEEISNDSHEAVDLGLSVKWATCNVGAERPEDYGDYFAWGETVPKNDYGWETYKWCRGTSDSMTKYCTDGKLGTVDNNTVLDLKDDVAHVKWRGKWRMPTREEFKELWKKCVWRWTTLNGVYGELITGPSGNSIFLPAAGYRAEGIVHNCNSYGGCWSTALVEYDCTGAYGIAFDDENFFTSDDVHESRDCGISVRPVTD